MRLAIGDQMLDLRAGAGSFELDGERLAVKLVSRRRRGESWELRLLFGDRPRTLWATPLADGSWAVSTPGGIRAIARARAADAIAQAETGTVTSPMAGVITRIETRIGELVASGQALAVVEAMKTRFTLTASSAGVVAEIHVEEGALVTAQQAIVRVAPQA